MNTGYTIAKKEEDDKFLKAFDKLMLELFSQRNEKKNEEGK